MLLAADPFTDRPRRVFLVQDIDDLVETLAQFDLESVSEAVVAKVEADCCFDPRFDPKTLRVSGSSNVPPCAPSPSARPVSPGCAFTGRSVGPV